MNKTNYQRSEEKLDSKIAQATLVKLAFSNKKIDDLTAETVIAIVIELAAMLQEKK